MLKTIVVLPDGQELSSGSAGSAAISGFTLTQCVNEERELAVGSVCAAMAELTVIDPAGTISLGRGQELTVYRQDELGQRQKVGIFLTETPTRPSRNILKPQLAVNLLESTVNLLTPTVPRCSHLGCALKWNPREHSWDCPCHGSRFAEDGKLMDNPATKGIKNSRSS